MIAVRAIRGADMATTGTGIDIGLRSAKALRGQFKGGTFHASAFSVGEHDVERLEDGWAGFQPSFKPTNARVGLTGKDVNLRYTRVPRVPDWQLRKLMHFEVTEIGDQSGSEVASDFNLLPELPEVEGEDIVLLAMARESLLNEHIEGLGKAGGSLDSFSPSAVALYVAWTHYGVVQDDTVLIANIGHEHVDVVIARGPDLLFARNLSGGSKLFDDAIAQRLSVNAKQAEQLKREYTTLVPGARYATPNHERASRAAQGAAGQLLSLLQSAAMFAKSQLKISGLKLDRVMLCGGGSALEGLPEYLSNGMGVRAELFDPFRVVDTSKLEPEVADELEAFRLESVVALGLATMGSDKDAYSLEVLPAAVAKRRAFWGGSALLIAAAVLAVAYLGWFAFDAKRDAAAIGLRARSMNSRLSRAKSTDQATRELLDSNAELSKVVQEMQTTAGMGEQLARGLTFLGDHLPGDFWVTRLTGEWGQDVELGVERGADPRPMLEVRGRVRESAVAPTSQHQELVGLLEQNVPGVRVNHSIDRGSFSIDLTTFAPPVAPAAEDEQ